MMSEVYELIEISIESGYVLPKEEITAFVREDVPGVENERNDKAEIEYDADGIPMGWTRLEIKAREKIIKDFYAKWIAEHPNKAITEQESQQTNLCEIPVNKRDF